MRLRRTSTLLAALAMGATVSQAATVLYSENFNGEGTGGADYNDGTTPEINVGSIGTLQATGVSQGGNGTDTAWLVNFPGTGARGLRFGGGENWATGPNAGTILAAGGFSVSFDYDVPVTNPFSWASVRVGSGGENSDVNAGDVTFGVLARANTQMQTFDDGAGDSFGSVGTVGLHTALFKYEFNSWAAGTTVTFTGIIDGNTIATDTFTWNVANDVKIVFSADLGGTTIDNIVVSTIPEPGAALLGGLGLLGLLRRRRA